MSWKIVYTKQARKDAVKIKQAELKDHGENLLKTLRENPYEPPFEKLVGDLQGAYSRRINIKHRLVYEICDNHVIKIVRMWTHYE